MSSNNAHSRRTFLKAAGSATAAVALAGCIGGDDGGNDGGGGPSGELIYSRSAASETLDPHGSSSGEVAKVTNQAYDQLILFEAGKTSLRDGLAKEYSVDGTTATLKLRQGAKFHNGEEFTADDFKATYRRFTDPKYKHYPGKKNLEIAYADAVYGKIKSVTVSDKYKLEIELKEEFVPFLKNLAMFPAAVMSKKAIEGDTDLTSNPVGTGAFKFEQSQNQNSQIQFSANTDYWGEVPKVGNLIFDTTSKNSTRVQDLSSGNAHITDGLDATTAKQVQNDSKLELKSKPGLNIGYLAFNMERVEPFRKKKVRQALNYAVNTKAIVNTIFKGFAQRASQPVPPGILGYNEELDPYGHDPEKAKQMLADAGHGDGLTFTMAVPNAKRAYNPNPDKVAQQFKSDFANVGVTVKINKMKWDKFLNYTETGKHDACFLGWMTDNGDPNNFFNALLHPGAKIPEGQDWVSFDAKNFNTFNVAAWANKEYVKLVEEGVAVSDEAKRKKIYNKAGKIAHDEAPWVFIAHAKEQRGISKTVSGFTVGLIGGPYLNTVSVEQ